MSELPYDLVIVHAFTYVTSKVQVKYRTLTNDVLTVRVDSFWANAKGTHTTKLNRNAVNGVVTYCPDTDECYYIGIEDIQSSGIWLRVEEPRQGWLGSRSRPHSQHQLGQGLPRPGGSVWRGGREVMQRLAKPSG